MLRLSLVVCVVSSAIVASPGARAACMQDGTIVQVGPAAASPEASTFGYRCVDDIATGSTLVGPRDPSVVRFGDDRNDPEKDTYGFGRPAAPK